MPWHAMACHVKSTTTPCATHRPFFFGLKTESFVIRNAQNDATSNVKVRPTQSDKDPLLFETSIIRVSRRFVWPESSGSKDVSMMPDSSIDARKVGLELHIQCIPMFSNRFLLWNQVSVFVRTIRNLSWIRPNGRIRLVIVLGCIPSIHDCASITLVLCIPLLCPCHTYEIFMVSF